MLPTTSKVVAPTPSAASSSTGGTSVENVARHRGDEGQDHQREHEARRRPPAVAKRRPREQKANSGNVPEGVYEEGLDVGLHHRSGIIDAPNLQ